MHENNREDIQNLIDYSFISLMSSKLKIGVIGGGKAGEIKIKHLVNNKCYVEVLSKSFTDGIVQLSKRFESNLKLINEEFSYEFLKNKHLIIIALDDESLKDKIKKYCDDNFKIYIDSSNFLEGMGVIPVERSTNNMNFALNTKGGNPKGAVFVCNKIKDMLEEYDDFIEITTKLRKNAKLIINYKSDILKFIYSEKFEEAFNNGKYKECLELKFPKDIVEQLLK